MGVQIAPICIIFTCLFTLPLAVYCVKRWLIRHPEWLTRTSYLRRSRLLTFFVMAILVFLPVYLWICWNAIIRFARDTLSDPQIANQNQTIAKDTLTMLGDATAVVYGGIVPAIFVGSGVFLLQYRMYVGTTSVWPDTFIFAELFWSLATLTSSWAFLIEYRIYDLKEGRYTLERFQDDVHRHLQPTLAFSGVFIAVGMVFWIECLVKSVRFRYMLCQQPSDSERSRTRRTWYGRRWREHSILPSTASRDSGIYQDEANRMQWPQRSWL